jgi:hypothetical protein
MTAMSRLMPRCVALATVAPIGAALLTAPAAPAAAADGSWSAGGRYSNTLRRAVAVLPVAVEVRTGYSRAAFPHWIDADRDRCDTRAEVLYAEARTKPRISAPCTLTGGRWYSPYDNRYWTRASDLDVDHLVALAEAWDSGARRWSAPTRRAFANDLGDARTLAAVTDNVNAAKGDRDPAQWLPPHAAYRCTYIAHWTAVKIRWRLSVDQTEKTRLTALANHCPATIKVTVTRAI